MSRYSAGVRMERICEKHEERWQVFRFRASPPFLLLQCEKEERRIPTRYSWSWNSLRQNFKKKVYNERTVEEIDYKSDIKQ